MARSLIWLVRHAQTGCERERARVQGPIDVPRTRRGRRQASALAARVGAAAASRPVSARASHLPRARRADVRIGAAGFRFAGGESPAEQMERVVACLTGVARAPDALPAVIACHGGTNRGALCHARRRGLAAFHPRDVPNGAPIGR